MRGTSYAGIRTAGPLLAEGALPAPTRPTGPLFQQPLVLLVFVLVAARFLVVVAGAVVAAPHGEPGCERPDPEHPAAGDVEVAGPGEPAEEIADEADRQERDREVHDHHVDVRDLPQAGERLHGDLSGGG